MTRKTSMSKIREIISGLQAGLSYSKIRKEFDCSNGFINKVSRTVAASGLTAESMAELSDADIVKLMYPPTPKNRRQPDFAVLSELIKKKGISLDRAYQIYRSNDSEDGQKPYSYQSFCRLWKQWSGENLREEVVCNYELIPGERIEIDFSGDDVVWRDLKNTEHISRLFVACLPYSGMIYAQAFEDEKQNSWLQGIIGALQYFEGVPSLLIMDNAKALVKRTDGQNSVIQPAVQDLCDHYDMIPSPCNPFRPKQKNRVEASVRLCQKWVIGEMELYAPIVAQNLPALNEEILRRVTDVNRRPWTNGRSGSRWVCFKNEEVPHLKPLPKHPYELCEWKVLVVDKGHCVRLQRSGGHRYSVPAEYAHKKVHVRIGRHTIVIFDMETGAKLAVHERTENDTGPRTHILPAHLTPQERDTRISREEWFKIFLADGIPEDVVLWFMSEAWSTDLGGRRACQALRKLSRQYRFDIFLSALSDASKHNQHSVLFIKQVCENRQKRDRLAKQLDAQSEENSGKTTETDYITPEHKNVRGNYA